MQEGKMFYNRQLDRMDIRFKNGSTYGGLHCGETMDAKINDIWVPTRIEMSRDWYLIGLKGLELDGMTVRI